MIKCVKCNAELADDTQFCNECGTKVEQASTVSFCSECGNKIESSSEFCNKCGNRLLDKEKNTVKSDINKQDNIWKSLSIMGKFPNLGKHKIPFVAISLCVLIITVIFINLANSGNKEAEEVIAQTIKDFNRDFSSCIDLSVFLDNSDLDFKSVRDYCAPEIFGDMDREFTTNAQQYNILRQKDLARTATGGWVSAIPYVGNVLNKLMTNQFDTEPLFNAKNWEVALNWYWKLVNVKTNHKNDRAEVVLQWDYHFNGKSFQNSALLDVSNVLDSIMLEDFNKSGKTNAVMEKQLSGEWVFTSFDLSFLDTLSIFE